jgi:uncharacterized protein YprB with RNaseH-like and TPR domain
MLDRERVLRALGAARKPARAAPAPGPRPRPPLAEILGGEWRPAGEGSVFVKETWFPVAARHGAGALGAALETPPQALRDAFGLELSPHGLVFFDVETTGLSGGTGTCIFLAGLGSFAEGGFRLRQYFLSALECERPMLALLSSDLAAFQGIVTYNGRAFDLPALDARLTLSRLPRLHGELAHLDLLRPVRRLYAHRLESCRLAAAEAAILAHHRRDDVPGHLIPSLYFDFIRCGRASPLRGVFRHNADDVLSMAGILAAVSALFAAEELEPADAAAVARWWECERQPDRAAALYARALPGLAGERDWSWAAARYALLLKRAGRRREAADLWRELWAGGDRAAAVEIAKYLEHQARDLAAAEEVAAALLAGTPAAERAEVRRRLERIRRKRAGLPGGRVSRAGDFAAAGTPAVESR